MSDKKEELSAATENNPRQRVFKKKPILGTKFTKDDLISSEIRTSFKFVSKSNKLLKKIICFL